MFDSRILKRLAADLQLYYIYYLAQIYMDIFALCSFRQIYAFFTGFNNRCLFVLFHTPSYKKAFRTDK